MRVLKSPYNQRVPQCHCTAIYGELLLDLSTAPVLEFLGTLDLDFLSFFVSQKTGEREERERERRERVIERYCRASRYSNVG